MFNYTVPKSSCWGHIIRPKDPVKAKLCLNSFFATYFEPLVPEWDVTRQFDFFTTWNKSVLPNIHWSDDFLNAESQSIFFLLTGDRVIFTGGIPFPISTSEPASYEFLKRFASDAPFRINSKNFRVRGATPNGRWAWKKPDADIAERLNELFK
jgi:hypothetical protein